MVACKLFGGYVLRSLSKYSFWLALCVFSIAAPAHLLAAESGKTLRALVQDSMPKYFVDQEGKVTGMCGEIYDRLAIRLGHKGIKLNIDDHVTPIKRILRSLESGKGDIYCGAGRNAKREKLFIYSSAPVYEVSNVVAAHAEDPINPKSFADLAQPHLTVGAYYGTSSAAFLMKQPGVRVNEGFHDLSDALRMVSLKKLRLFYYHDLGLNYLVKNAGYPLRVVPTKFRITPQWIIYSPYTDPELREALDKEISTMVKNGEMRAITENYLP